MLTGVEQGASCHTHLGSSCQFYMRRVMSPKIASVVFVRHGESQGNAKNVYTGWDDTPLSIRGEQEAVEAGLCLKAKVAKIGGILKQSGPLLREVCMNTCMQKLHRQAHVFAAFLHTMFMPCLCHEHDPVWPTTDLKQMTVAGAFRFR